MINAIDFQRRVNHWKWENWGELYGGEASSRPQGCIGFGTMVGRGAEERVMQGSRP